MITSCSSIWLIQVIYQDQQPAETSSYMSGKISKLMLSRPTNNDRYNVKLLNY